MPWHGQSSTQQQANAGITIKESTLEASLFKKRMAIPVANGHEPPMQSTTANYSLIKALKTGIERAPMKKMTKKDELFVAGFQISPGLTAKVLCTLWTNLER